jgi:Spy/CpxP family protein refolding chaperone
MARETTIAATLELLAGSSSVRCGDSGGTALAPFRAAWLKGGEDCVHHRMESANGFSIGDARQGTAAHRATPGIECRRFGWIHSAEAAKQTVAGHKTSSAVRRSHMKLWKLLFIPLVFTFAAGAWAQKPADDQVAHNLFPPELVMRFHQEINLDESQSQAMKEAIHKAQAKFLDMQWDMQAETEKLAKLLKAHPVDEQAVMAQMDQVLNRERDIKKAQMSLLIHIKNLLSEAQQNKLMELASETLFKQH